MFLTRLRSVLRLSAVRLTASLLLVLAVVIFLAGAATYWLVEREITRLADARLMTMRDATMTAVEAGTALPMPGFGQDILVLSGNSSGDEDKGTLPFPLPDVEDGMHVLDLDDTDFRYLVHTTPDGRRIVIAENTERQDEMLDTLSGGLQLSVVGALVAGLLSGLWFAWHGQRRLGLISDGLAAVAEGDLATRITLPGPEDDLSVLADRINATTARLEQSMEQLRAQTSNIAHDLRTPLARLRAGIEASLIDLADRSQPVEAETLEIALEQIDRITGTFDALLRLSRIESSAGRDAFASVDLDALVPEVAETFTPTVEEAGQRLVVSIENAARINGDHDLLVQLLANLIQNALRYGAADQDITLGVDGHCLSVADQGPGIPESERAKVLQPLYQRDATRQDEGYGLGLSMVAAIARLHGASLLLSHGPDGRGLSVDVHFPKLTSL